MGFFGKLFVFWAAIQANLGWLVLIGVLNSAVSLFYYAQVIHDMYMVPAAAATRPERSPSLAVSLGISVAGLALLGVFSGFFFGIQDVAARTLGH